MKEPDILDKKYSYFHKKAGKRFLNNQLYAKDVKKYNEWLASQPKSEPIKTN